jgi:hypothetical protein
MRPLWPWRSGIAAAGGRRVRVLEVLAPFEARATGGAPSPGLAAQELAPAGPFGAGPIR